MKLLRALALSTAALLWQTIGTCQEVPLAEAINTSWAANSLWEDGNAEVAHYNGSRVIYGEPRPHTLTLITVKEDLNTEYYVKADWPYGQKPILATVKQNQIATILTPNYPYHFMTSVFFERADIRNAVKLTSSSQEWCGMTFKEFQLWKDIPVFRLSSYWDGEGTLERGLPGHGENTWFEEELPLLVRTLTFKHGLTALFELQPSQITSKGAIPTASQARLIVDQPAHAIETTIGPYSKTQVWHIGVGAEDGRALDFFVEAEYPNRLLAWSHSDGREYRIDDIRRWQYWRIGG